ncbi:hypothetical protein TNCV_611191 [Trichonephila clavipes]|nr:hypothetical protein TNCV_611191 [Trichonephila clavipes]
MKRSFKSIEKNKIHQTTSIDICGPFQKQTQQRSESEIELIKKDPTASGQKSEEPYLDQTEENDDVDYSGSGMEQISTTHFLDRSLVPDEEKEFCEKYNLDYKSKMFNFSGRCKYFGVAKTRKETQPKANRA